MQETDNKIRTLKATNFLNNLRTITPTVDARNHELDSILRHTITQEVKYNYILLKWFRSTLSMHSQNLIKILSKGQSINWFNVSKYFIKARLTRWKVATNMVWEIKCVCSGHNVQSVNSEKHKQLSKASKMEVSQTAQIKQSWRQGNFNREGVTKCKFRGGALRFYRVL